MHHHLTAATLKGGADRRCGDSSDVPKIAPRPRLLLFNAAVIALLALIENPGLVGRFQLAPVNVAAWWLSSGIR